jgi:hypothetical protein
VLRAERAAGMPSWPELCERYGCWHRRDGRRNSASARRCLSARGVLGDACQAHYFVLQRDGACLHEGVARRPRMADGMGTDGTAPHTPQR